jgi:hypothetical protein
LIVDEDGLSGLPIGASSVLDGDTASGIAGSDEFLMEMPMEHPFSAELLLISNVLSNTAPATTAPKLIIDGKDSTGRAIVALRGTRIELPSSPLIVIESEKKSTFAAASTGIRKNISTCASIPGAIAFAVENETEKARVLG